jgi:multidrug efflux pump subunit AcrA (membrane-fusion protein)
VKIFGRILVFVGFAVAFALAVIWKIGDVKEQRNQEVTTIQNEYQEQGRPVVTYEVGAGPLFLYEKLTFERRNRQLQAETNASQAEQLRPGQRFTILNAKGTGRIRRVSYRPDLLTGLYQVRARVDSELANLPATLIARVTLDEFTVKARIPINAVLTATDGQAYVWTVQDGQARRVEVELGRSDLLYYEVSKGLSPDQVVVTKGARYLDEGDKVRPVGEQNPSLELADKPI